MSHCWPPALSSLSQSFLTILNWMRISDPQWRLFLPFPWNEQSPWSCRSSRSHLPPLLTVGDPFLYHFADSPLPNAEPQAAGPAFPLTHSSRQSVLRVPASWQRACERVLCCPLPLLAAATFISRVNGGIQEIVSKEIKPICLEGLGVPRVEVDARE